MAKRNAPATRTSGDFSARRTGGCDGARAGTRQSQRRMDLSQGTPEDGLRTEVHSTGRRHGTNADGPRTEPQLRSTDRFLGTNTTVLETKRHEDGQPEATEGENCFKPRGFAI